MVEGKLVGFSKQGSSNAEVGRKIPKNGKSERKAEKHRDNTERGNRCLNFNNRNHDSKD